VVGRCKIPQANPFQTPVCGLFNDCECLIAQFNCAGRFPHRMVVTGKLPDAFALTAPILDFARYGK
jgi:hypothetical protein